MFNLEDMMNELEKEEMKKDIKQLSAFVVMFYESLIEEGFSRLDAMNFTIRYLIELGGSNRI
mgnify:CR=1 FL=1